MLPPDPLYVSLLDIPKLSAEDWDMLKTASQYVVALLAFLLITLPATVRARVQLHIERSKLTQEIIDAFESAYRKNGVVIAPPGSRRKYDYDLLSMLNSKTVWTTGKQDVVIVDGERFITFALKSDILLDTALISVEHLHVVSSIFRRIGIGLDTGTLRRRDLNAMWNNIMVWTYANRLDFMMENIGASRVEFTRVLGSLCRTFPIQIRKHSVNGRDFFGYVTGFDLVGQSQKRLRYTVLTHMGLRAALRLRYVIFYEKTFEWHVPALIGWPVRAVMKAFNSLMRGLKLF